MMLRCASMEVNRAIAMPIKAEARMPNKVATTEKMDDHDTPSLIAPSFVVDPPRSRRILTIPPLRPVVPQSLNPWWGGLIRHLLLLVDILPNLVGFLQF